MRTRKLSAIALVVALASCTEAVTEPVGSEPQYELALVNGLALPAPFAPDTLMHYMRGRLDIVDGIYKVSTETKSETFQLDDKSGTAVLWNFWSDSGVHVEKDDQTFFASVRRQGLRYPAQVYPDSVRITRKFISPQKTYAETMVFRRRR